MNAERLLAHYDQIADGPDAIGRLRRFILDMAVRGKLVPQDPKDEPATELLKRIVEEKARLVKAGEIKVRSVFSRDRHEPLVFDCPFGWSLTELGEVALKISDGAHKTPTYVEHGVPFVSVKDFSAGQLNLSSTRFIPEHEHELLYQRCDPRRGDILLGRIGTLGKAVLVDTDVEFSLFVSVGLIRFDHRFVNPEFFRLLLNSPFVEAEFDRIKIGGGTHTNKLNLGDLYTVALPLPPLAEQHRIIAKVAELMVLCDRLEAARTEREATRDRLAASSLSRLNVPDPGTFQDDARFVLNALPALTTRPDQIKHLRQSIITLAVRGYLVPQDPSHEAALQTIRQIVTVSGESGEQCLAPKLKSETIASDDLPSGWQRVRLDMLGTVGTGSTPLKARSEFYENGDIPWITSSSTSDGIICKAEHFITCQAVRECRLKLYPAGSLVIALYGQGKTRGQVAELGIDATVNQACAVIQLRPAAREMKRFIHLALIQQYESIRERAEGGPQPNLNLGKIKERILAIPPLAEQKRIVAKVDELLVLCDRLESEIRYVASTRRHLFDALLSETLTRHGEIEVVLK